MMTATTDPRLLRIDEEDNVLIVTAPIEAGQDFIIDGETVSSPVALALGFKVAAGDLEEGAIATRHGTSIGRTTSSVKRGQLVHTHNLESLYMRTHARGEA